MKPVVSVLAGLLALGGAACAPPTDVQTTSLETAPIVHYRTFSFAPTTGASAYHQRALSDYPQSPRSAHVIDLMKASITQALEQKGYVLAPPGQGELVILCSAGRRDVETVVGRSWRVTARGGDGDETRSAVEGGIVIDVLDRTGGQVWHGAATTEIDPQKPDDARVRGVVDRVMKPFPARPPAR